MKRKGIIKIIFLSLLIVSLLFCGTASALTVTGCTVTNTNIYTPSNQNDIAPSGTYSSSTATGITHVSGRYIYATGMTASPNPALVNEEVTFTVTGQQGATILDSGTYAEAVHMHSFGDDTSSASNKHEYAAAGTYQPSVYLENPSNTNGINVNGEQVTVLPANPEISAVTLTSSTPAPLSSPITATVSATSPGGSALSYQWFYNKNGGAAWIALSGQTSSTMTYQPIEAGTYKFKVTVTDSSGSTDSYVAGFTDVTAQIVTAPTLGTATINMEHGAVGTSYNPEITIPVTGMGGSGGVYLKAQYSTNGGTTWSDGLGSTVLSPTEVTLEAYSFTDTTPTTHSYRVLATTIQNDWRPEITATSNTVTFQTFVAPTIPTVSISPTQIKISTAATVILSAADLPTAPAGNPYTYKWYYGLSATPSAADIEIGTWTSISNPYSWNIPATLFTQEGTRYVYLQISDSVGHIVKSAPAVLTLSDIAPPTINSVTLTSSSPALIGSTVTAAVSAVSYQGTTADLTYKWYYSLSSQVSWTEISGQTAAALTTSFSSGGMYLIKSVVTDTSIGESSDSYAVGKYAAVQIVPVPSISSVAVNPYTLDLSLSNSVQLSSVILNPSGVSSMVWQVQKNSGGWVDTTLTQGSGSVTVTDEGTYLYRLKVTPVIGSVIYSESTHSVIAGHLPVISIIQPDNNAQFGIGETINIIAEATGLTSVSWDFGSGIKASGNTNTLTPWVQYSGLGKHTITVTAGNPFGTKTASVVIAISSSKRPLAVSTPAPITDAAAIFEWADYTKPQSAEDQSPDIWGLFVGLTKPFTNVMGQWFYLALFAVPYLLIWIATRNTMIPSILGILFGAWLLVMLPGSAMAAAVCILVLSVSGGIFGIYLSRRQRE